VLPPLERGGLVEGLLSNRWAVVAAEGCCQAFVASMFPLIGMNALPLDSGPNDAIGPEGLSVR